MMDTNKTEITQEFVDKQVDNPSGVLSYDELSLEEQRIQLEKELLELEREKLDDLQRNRELEEAGEVEI